MQEESNFDGSEQSLRGRTFSLENMLFYVLSGLVLLLPIIFIPALSVPLVFVKYGLLVIAIVVAVAIWILLRLKDGVFLFPINMLNLAGLFVLVIMLVSTLLSGSIWNSLIGQLTQTDTFIFYLYAFIIMFMVPNVFNSSKRIFALYKIFFVSLGLLALFHVLRLATGPGLLSFGYFPSPTDNTFGSWNDLGIFFGLGAVLSFISIELFMLTKRYKITLYAILIVSMILLAVINFSSIWYVLAALSLVFFVHSIVINRSTNVNKNKQISLPVTSFVIFLISVIFIIGGARIGNVISAEFNISQIQVVPTWQTTFKIGRSVITQGPVRFAIGDGPNRFVNAWQLYKPVDVNNSIYWNTDFNSGVGIIPSTLATEGVLGFLAWLAFLGLLVYMGFRAIFSRIDDPFQRYLVTSSFLAALYLWLFNMIYVPGLIIIILTFFFTGLFIASLQESGILKPTPFEFFKNPRISFVSVLVLIFILICGLGLVYMTVSKFVAVSYYNKALVEVNNNNLDGGEQDIKNAMSFDTNDLYARALAELYLVRLGNLLSAPVGTASTDTLKNQFTVIANTALSAAKLAVQLKGTDYQNWLTLGDVWTALVPLKINQSYESATAAYQNAFNENPQNPYIYLQIAKLDSAQNNGTQAIGDLSKALTLKNNYTDAYLFLAQLQASAGDTKSAIDSATNAAISAPNNPGIFFQLGLLRYDSKDYQDAIGALEQAVSLNNQYSNAKYFLGLSYYQVGRTADAITEFSDIQKLNPDSQQVADILANLKAGLAPLVGSQSAAVTSTPTGRTATSTTPSKAKAKK